MPSKLPRSPRSPRSPRGSAKVEPVWSVFRTGAHPFASFFVGRGAAGRPLPERGVKKAAKAVSRAYRGLSKGETRGKH